jgi:transketolase
MNYEEALRRAAEADPRLVVLTAENRAAIRNLPAVLGDRFIDVGICEQTMIGAAAGLALRGRIPVVHALASFLTMRAFEFIRTDVGIAGLPVKLVGGVAGLLSEANGPTHQAIEDLALMRGIPGVQIFCPADEDELVQALPSILASPLPCYVRHTPRRSRLAHAPYQPGQAEVLHEGSEATILCAGLLVEPSVEAAALLANEGFRVRVLNLRTLRPLDHDAILRAARETRLLVTVEDHFLTGGLRTAVAELLVEKEVSASLLPIGLPERWFRPGLLPDVLAHEGLDARGLAERIAEALNRRRQLARPAVRRTRHATDTRAVGGKRDA